MSRAKEIFDQIHTELYAGTRGGSDVHSKMFDIQSAFGALGVELEHFPNLLDHFMYINKGLDNDEYRDMEKVLKKAMKDAQAVEREMQKAERSFEKIRRAIQKTSL